MIAPAVFWPTVLGAGFLLAGILTYRRDLMAGTSRGMFGVVTLGPVFMAAALAAFAGEHFTAARSLAQLVPKWMPAHLFIAYFVGVAHLAAALSFVARRYVRWSALCLALMFSLFVLLMDLPGTLRHPSTLLNWSLTARETTFAFGALALFVTDIRSRRPSNSGPANMVASITRVWIAFVLVFYGFEHLLHPQYSPGVPDSTVTASWVPLPHALALITGVFLMACGIALMLDKFAVSAGAMAGLLMALLTAFLYLPNYFLARSVPQYVNALNFIFDTLLFSGTLFVITRVILDSEPQPAAISHSAY